MGTDAELRARMAELGLDNGKENQPSLEENTNDDVKKEADDDPDDLDQEPQKLNQLDHQVILYSFNFREQTLEKRNKRGISGVLSWNVRHFESGRI